MISKSEIEAFFNNKQGCCQPNSLVSFLEKCYPQIENWEVYFYLQDLVNTCFKTSEDEVLSRKLYEAYEDAYIKRRACFINLVGQATTTDPALIFRAIEDLAEFFGRAKIKINNEEYNSIVLNLSEQYVNCYNDFYDLIGVISNKYRSDMFPFFNKKLVELLRQGLDNFQQDMALRFIEKGYKYNFEITEALAIKIIITTEDCNIILYLTTLLKNLRAVKIIGLKKIELLNNLDVKGRF